MRTMPREALNVLPSDGEQSSLHCQRQIKPGFLLQLFATTTSLQPLYLARIEGFAFDPLSF